MTRPRPPHSADLRKHRVSQPYALYFITKCLLKGHRFTEGQRHDLCESFQHFREKKTLFLQAFVVMPDHWHALFVLGDVYRLDTAIQQLNSWASFPTRQSGGSIAWMEEYRDELVGPNESAVDIVGYIEANPVRKGWVPHEPDWPWSSAHPNYAGKLDREVLGLRAWDRKR